MKCLHCGKVVLGATLISDTEIRCGSCRNLLKSSHSTNLQEIAKKKQGNCPYCGEYNQYFKPAGDNKLICRKCGLSFYIETKVAPTGNALQNENVATAPDHSQNRPNLQKQVRESYSSNRNLLLSLMVEYFSLDELKSLCFILMLDYDDLEGQRKTDKIRNLIIHCESSNRIPVMIMQCEKLRPNVSWPEPWHIGGRKTLVDPTELFHDATRHRIQGDVGRALELYMQVKQIDPHYPRLDTTIRAVEIELGKPYVDPDGFVHPEKVYRPMTIATAPKDLPSAKQSSAKQSRRMFLLSPLGIILLILLIVLVLYFISRGF